MVPSLALENLNFVVREKSKTFNKMWNGSIQFLERNQVKIGHVIKYNDSIYGKTMPPYVHNVINVFFYY